jgi:hypothetical protein
VRVRIAPFNGISYFDINFKSLFWKMENDNVATERNEGLLFRFVILTVHVIWENGRL